MSILERTAATIDPRGIHRAFPLSLPSCRLRSGRKLPVAFWHNSAAELELSAAWQALVGTNVKRNSPTGDDAMMPVSGPSSGPGSGFLFPAAFLLDFLYPRGIVTGLPRLSTTFLPIDILDRPKPSHQTRLHLRSYASSTPTPAAEFRDSNESARTNTLEDCSPSLAGSTEPMAVNQPRQDLSLKKFVDVGDPVETRLSHSSQIVEALVELRKMMEENQPRKSNPSKFNKALQTWESLQGQDKHALQEEVFKFLCGIAGPPADGGINSAQAQILKNLYDNLPRTRMARANLSSYIKAQFLLERTKSVALNSALKILDRAMDENIVGGLGFMAAQLLMKRSFSRLIKMVSDADEAMRRRGTKLGKQNFSEIPPTQSSVYLVKAFNQYFDQQDQKTNSGKRQAIQAMISAMAGHLAEKLNRPSYLEPIMDLSPKAMYKVLDWYIRNDNRKDAARIYRMYRQIPDISIQAEMLNSMFGIFKSLNDRAGILEVLNDWKINHRTLTYGAYRDFLQYFSALGDLPMTEQLWADFVEYQRRGIKRGRRRSISKVTFALMLNCYAERGALSSANRFFREISRHVQPSQVLWNILLKTYRRANDYAGALEVFKTMFEKFDRQSVLSLRYMASMAAVRGDIDFILWLVSEQRKYTRHTDVVTMAAVVQALCQNDQYAEAEKVTLESTSKVNGDPVLMWNVLLEYSARQHDLGNLSRLLGLLEQHGVRYNKDTYSWLLRGLSYCRQTPHAEKMLRIALRRDHQHVSAEHFLIVFSSSIGTRETHRALRLLELTKSSNMTRTTQDVLSELSALRTWRRFGHAHEPRLGNVEFLSAVLAILQRCVIRLENKDHVDKRLLVRPGDVEKIVTFCVLMKDFATANEIIAAFQKMYPPNLYPEKYTLQLLNALILAHSGDGEFDIVDSVWKKLFDNVKREARIRAFKQSESDAKPSMRMVWDMQAPITSMMRSCLLRNDSDRLSDVVREVREAGFELNNVNWNLYIQFLARLGELKAAFVLCEKVLMPGWHGWHLRFLRTRARLEDVPYEKLPLETRRLLTSRLYLNPSKVTILKLSKAFMDLEAESAWVSSKVQEINALRKLAPLTLQAMRNLGNLFSFEQKRLRSPGFYGDELFAMEEKRRADQRNASLEQASMNSIERDGNIGDSPEVIDEPTPSSPKKIGKKLAEWNLSSETHAPWEDWAAGIEMPASGSGLDEDTLSEFKQEAATQDMSYLTGGRDNWQDINKVYASAFKPKKNEYDEPRDITRVTELIDSMGENEWFDESGEDETDIEELDRISREAEEHREKNGWGNDNTRNFQESECVSKEKREREKKDQPLKLNQENN